jgi:hypothetical protein
MKKVLGVLTVVGLLALSLVTAGPALANRAAAGTYRSPSAGAGGVGLAGCAEQDAVGCVILAGGPEDHVSITIEDTTGLDVAASITQDLDGDGMADTGTDFCTKTPAPVAISPGFEVDVFIFSGPCTAPPGPGGATSGTVTGTFTGGTGGGGGGGGGGAKPSPKPTIKFSNMTPKKGSKIKAKVGLKVCNKKTRGTKIQLQKKTKHFYKTIATKKLNTTCKATFTVKAKFRKRTFRSAWKSQSNSYSSAASKPKTVVTHP